jgi:hypothetical protein
VEFDVQPIYGWGWRSKGHNVPVPAPFRMKTVVNERGEFKTAIGRFDDPAHPLSGMWVVLSPIQATKTWEFSHVCAFPNEPSIPVDLKNLVESAPLTGFAKAFPI